MVRFIEDLKHRQQLRPLAEEEHLSGAVQRKPTLSGPGIRCVLEILYISISTLKDSTYFSTMCRM
jgi:hypothetical protein